MNNPLTALAIIFFTAFSASGVAQAREEYTDVTAVVAEAVHGAMELRVEDPEKLKVLMQEINAVRRKSWGAYQGKLASCAVRLTFFSADRRVGRLVVQGNELLELGVNQTSGYKRELGTFDAPSARRLAARIRRPSECNK